MLVKSFERQEHNMANATVTVEKERFQQELDKVYKSVRKDIYIPGFRKGKAPRKLVERMYGDTVFYDDGIESIADEVWTFVVENTEEKIVGAPAIANYEKAENGDVDVVFSFGLYPEVTLGEYRGVEGVKPEVAVEEKDIDDEIENLRKRNAREVRMDRAAEDGDEVSIDFAGTVDGEAFDGGESKDYRLKLGSNVFIPGFEDQVVGMSMDEERDITVTFPEDYQADNLAGKEAVFHVKLNGVYVSELPEVDEDFVMDVSEEANTLEELREEIKTRLTGEKEEAAKSAFRQNVLQNALNLVEADIPAPMVTQVADQNISELRVQLESNGMKLEDVLSWQGMTINDLRSRYQADAETSVKYRLLFDAVAAAEGLDLTEEELDKAYADLAEEYNVEVEDVRKYFTDEDVKAEKLREKAQEIIVENAVAIDPPAEEAETAEAEAAAEETAEETAE